MASHPDSLFCSMGGSNDQSYANLSAYIGQFGGQLAVINIDAHFDVRPLKEGKAHSGSPFRLMLEDSRF
jgi:formiminoglutamase